MCAATVGFSLVLVAAAAAVLECSRQLGKGGVFWCCCVVDVWLCSSRCFSAGDLLLLVVVPVGKVKRKAQQKILGA